MKTKMFFSLMVIVAITSITTSVMAGGFYIDHFGARGAAMGNTYLGRPTSATTIFHNPAGLVLLEKSELRADLRMASVESEYNPAVDQPGSKEDAGLQLSPFVGGATKIGDLSFGIGVYSPFGIALDYDTNWGRYQVTEVDLKTVYFNPAVAYPISDTLSVGLGVSYVYATVEQTLHMDPLGLGLLDYDAVATLDIEDTAAFGANFGIHYHNGPLFIGASYFFHPTLELEGDVKMVLPPALGGVTLTDVVSSMDIELCDTARFGVGYEVTDKLFLQGEIDWIGWGENDQYIVDFKDNTASPDLIIEKKWEDTVGFRFGGEYLLTENIMVRAGYEYDGSAIPMETVDISVPDADKHLLTLGGGYHTDAFQVDIAYLHFMLDDTTVTSSLHDIPGLPSTHEGDYSASLDWVHLTLGYLF